MQGVTTVRHGFSTRRIAGAIGIAMLASLVASGGMAAEGTHDEHDSGHGSSRMTDEVVFDPNGVPDRPWRFELGDAFVGTGNISHGFTLPTGAVWTPSLLIWGSYRTALQTFETGNENDPLCSNGRGGSRCSEWANRLDIFANLILSGTERILVGMRPFDEGFCVGNPGVGCPNPATGNFSGYYFEGGALGTNSRNRDGRWNNATNADLITLFFEGDISEMFPKLDPEDKYPLDISFTVGRQQLFYQEGLLMFDFMDAVGVTKNSIVLRGASNLQISGLFAWNEINRGNNAEVDDTELYGLFFAVDAPWSTINLDLIFTNDRNPLDQDGFYTGLSFVQRFGQFATAFRAVVSVAVNDLDGSVNNALAPTSVVDTGAVLFGEFGFSPVGTHDNLYVNAFWGIGQYTPATRMPGTGGPMGRAGINFAGQGLGRYAASVANFAQDVVGLTLGYQMILDGAQARRQIVFELAGRQPTTKNSNTPAPSRATAALAVRFQQAFGRHVLLQLDTFGRVMKGNSPGWGARMEWRYNF